MIEYITVQENLLNKIKSLRYESAINNYFKTNYPDVDFNTPEIISKEAQKILQEFENQPFFTGKMKYLYSLGMDEDIAKQVLNNIYDTHYSKYYWTIPAGRAGSLNYQKGKLEEEYQSIINPKDVSGIEQEVKKQVLDYFSLDTKYSKFDIKNQLKNIYTSLKYDKTPKASDLEEYFEIKDCLISNTVTGKMEHEFKIIKKKGDD